jgi:hypothetical protein
MNNYLYGNKNHRPSLNPRSLRHIFCLRLHEVVREYDTKTCEDEQRADCVAEPQEESVIKRARPDGHPVVFPVLVTCVLVKFVEVPPAFPPGGV